MKRVLFDRGNSNNRSAGLALFTGMALACWLNPTTLQAAPTINYVQGNYATPQSPQATVKVTFTAAQVGGDLNVVVVGWNDGTAAVNTVTDTVGNVYARAIGPTVITRASQSIYYAKSIASAAAAANAVTVTFSTAAVNPDIRILEYSGADPANPVDVTAAGSGSSKTSSSVAVTTTNATDLLFGANLVLTSTTGPGSGFTSRLLTQPDGDIAEDRMVTATGSYSATAPVSPSGQWIMQMVAFRTAPTGPDSQPPTAPGNATATAVSASQINLSWTASTDNVAVTGYLVERCQIAGCANFVQIGTAAGTSYSDTGLLPSTDYSYRVRATDAANNLSSYSNVAIATTSAGSSGTAGPPVFVTETHSATDGAGAAFNKSTLSLNVSGTNTLLIVAWHAEYDGGTPDSWTVTCSGVPGTLITDTNGYTGGDGNQRFRTYYWLNPPPGPNTIVVSNPYTGGNELAVSAVLLSSVSQANPLGTTGLDVSTTPRTGESETVNTTTGDLVVHVIADALYTTGVLGPGETSVSLANDGHHTQPGDGDASLWISTKPGDPSTTNVSSSGWAASPPPAPRVINGVAIVVHGSAPGPPTNLTATPVSSSQINLSWVAATNIAVQSYLIGQCQGSGCSTFTQIGTSTSTTFNNVGLAPATTYSYQVRAVDSAGNLTPYSNTASATTAGVDTQAPTAPGNLTAAGASSSQINLGWTASTDNVGVTGYLVERCQSAGCSNFVQIAAPTTTAFSDTGLTAGASYSYRVRATDAAGNLSGYSNTASGSTLVSSGTISYVQGNYATPQSSPTTVNVTFTAAQVAGDLNVVVAGWNDSTATVSGVTDSRGNTYALAVGPTTSAGAATQSIYFARNIVSAGAGANTVTVTFSRAAAFPDIRVLEYSGADPVNPVDVTAGSTGSSTNSSSAAVTTTNPTDLLFGANLVLTHTTGPGAGFTSRLLTQPDGDIAEDRMVTATGSYSASAPVSPSGKWIMQMVAFRTSAGGPTPLVNLSSASLNFGNQATGSTSNAQAVTLTNVGTAQLTIGSIAVSGGNSTDFAQTNNCGATLVLNANCTINVTFTPSTTGVRSSAVAVTSNAPGSPQTIALSGTGTGFLVSPRVTALTFTRTQQFTASSGGATWSVDGFAGGSASSGTITSAGLYTPPASIGTHTVTATTTTQSASATVYITNYPGTFTYHNDNLRTGQNPSETVLTLNNVNQNQFGKLFSYPLDGIAFASPLYVANISIPGQGFHNVVYVATSNDSVYAFDADGLSTNPLWSVSFLKSGVTTVPCADTGECGDIPTQIGIASTPVIDPASGTIYVVAATKEGANTWVQRLHALDITNGAEKFGGPVVLQASLPGTGSGSSGGKVAFDPLRENQRPGLLLNNGVVYLAFGSHGDNSPWHGWVLGYNATTLQQTMQYNATPNGNGGGIWQGGGGPGTDAGGNLYFVTSNGDFDVNTGGVDYGDSVVKLSPGGTVVDYFTPHDEGNMNVNNLDLGAGGPVLLLDQTTGSFPHLLIASGKSGTIYVINRDNLGKFNANNDNQIVQSLPGVLPNGTSESGNFSTPIFFNGYVYYGAVNDTIKAFQMTNGRLSTTPTSQSSAVYEVRGASFAISANTTTNGILWALQNNGASANNDVGNPGVLFAYNANDLTTVLYSSNAAGSRDTLDNATKFSVPLVANGKVFVAGQTQLTAYGLLP